MNSSITREQERLWIDAWRIAGPTLEAIRVEELRALTDEQARTISEMLLAAAPSPHDWRPDSQSSGFVEQQRIFARARS